MEGRSCTPLAPFFFAFYSKNLSATHTSKFLSLQTFLLRMSIWKKNRKIWSPSPSEHFEISVQNHPCLRGFKRLPRYIMSLGVRPGTRRQSHLGVKRVHVFRPQPEITTVHEMELVRQIRLKYSYTTIFIMTLLSSKCEHKNFGL